jgi:hypothetical protein
LTTARLFSEDIQSQKTRFIPVFVTLTYAKSRDYLPDHISRYLSCVRNWASRKDFILRYLWVHELTKAGKTHFHVLFWIPKRYQLPKSDKRGWWTFGSTKTEKVKFSVISYMAKYLSKGSEDLSNKIPKGARLTGFGGLSPASRFERYWIFLPSYCKEAFVPYSDLASGASYKPLRQIGGGWVWPPTKQYMSSPFKVSYLGHGAIFIQRIIGDA